MFWLIEANIASTGKLQLRNEAPSRFLNFRVRNILPGERSHFSFQIVAHEIEFVDTFRRRVECGFCRRQGEDQPAMTRIHGFEPEDVAEKGAVRLSVFAVENYVSAGNHLPLLRDSRNSSALPRPELVDMCSACKYANRMPVMVQIRNVPSDLHRELKARAALEGMSLSDYLLRELRHALDRPTLDEIRKRLASRQPVRPRPAPAAAVRAERKSR